MKTKLTAFRLPSDTIRKIDAIAKETQRSKTFIVRKAIEQYIEEYADYQIALDRLNDNKDEIISNRDMSKLIAK